MMEDNETVSLSVSIEDLIFRKNTEFRGKHVITLITHYPPGLLRSALIFVGGIIIGPTFGE